MQKESGMNKLNILNLAISDEGGAGIATRYYNDLFREDGHNSILVVKMSNLKNNGVVVLEKKVAKYSLNNLIKKTNFLLTRYFLTRKIGLVDPKYAFLNLFEKKKYSTARKILKNTPFKPDIIALYWISDFINSKIINDLQKLTKAKIVWFMTDNAPMTGGCHYPWECRGYENDCSNCPALLKKKEIAKENLSFKLNNLPKNLELVTGSESDYQRALNSYLFKSKTIHKIHAPLDENKFVPSDKSHAKAFFGIDSNKRVIYNGSISYIDLRKGSVLFQEALLLLQKKYEEEGKDINELLILIAGNKNEGIIEGLKIPIKRVSYLSESDLIKAYSAADVFVSSSLEDSGPLMVNQSIMCGTPVVSFDIGVAVDFVNNGETGYRVKLRNVHDLAMGIKKILDLDLLEYQRMSNNCRKIGTEKSGFKNVLLKLNEIFRN